LPDLRVTIEDIIAEGDTVVARLQPSAFLLEESHLLPLAVLFEDELIHREELLDNGQCRVKDFSNGNLLY